MDTTEAIGTPPAATRINIFGNSSGEKQRNGTTHKMMCTTENSTESKKGLMFAINNKTSFFYTFGTYETQRHATHVIPEPCSDYLAKLSVCKVYKNAMLVYKNVIQY